MRARTLEALIRAHERERQAWERERGELLDRIMHLSARPSQPWAVAPAETLWVPAEPDEDPDRVGAVADVDQVLLEEVQ